MDKLNWWAGFENRPTPRGSLRFRGKQKPAGGAVFMLLRLRVANQCVSWDRIPILSISRCLDRIGILSREKLRQHLANRLGDPIGDRYLPADVGHILVRVIDAQSLARLGQEIRNRHPSG